MTYQVLARKWRPRDFASLVGQDHVVRALTHALDQQRLHHAYLFTGTRGVGKTTLSRILAKALNCETGITSQPCGVCRACKEIDAGRFVDYVEMDAASNRGVDEMAALLERAIYAPVDARFKVYMIDEVHMLTNHAFNAMLKTLEEPPPHVKFILATTDPQKIPVTVLSRCLQFNLKQMPAGEIVSHLDRVLQAEGIEFEPQALRLLSRAADGSMRDALSLTDQAIAYAAGHVNEEAVRGMLGALDQHYLMRLLEHIVASDGVAVLALADEMAARSLSFSIALQDLAQWLNRIGWAQFAPASVLEEWPEAADIRRFANMLQPEQVQLFYQIATIGRSELGLAPDEYAGFTMTLLRMLAFRPMSGFPQSPGHTPMAASPSTGTAPLRTMLSPTDTPSTVAPRQTQLPPMQKPISPAPVATVVPRAESLPVTVSAMVPSSTPTMTSSTVSPDLPRPMPIASVEPAPPVPPRPAAPIASAKLAAPIANDPQAEEDRLLMAAFDSAPTPAPVPLSEPSTNPSRLGADASPRVAHASPARAALEALGALRGGARPSATTATPVRRPTERSAAPSASTPLADQRVVTTPSRTPPADAPSTGRESAASTASADDVPPWDSAPWDDDDNSAAAFLSSASPASAERPVSRVVGAAARADSSGGPVMNAVVSDSNRLVPNDNKSDVAAALVAAMPPAVSLVDAGFVGDWPALAAQLDIKGLAQQLAYQSELHAVDGSGATVRLNLRIPVAQLAAGAHVDKVVAALAERLGRAVSLQIDVGPAQRTAAAVESAHKAERQRHAEAAIAHDPFVQALLRDFDASILPGATQPLVAGGASSAASAA